MTRMRSLLFVPGDSEKKLAKSEGVAADILILDLEDSVSSGNKQTARAQVAEFLSRRDRDHHKQVWVRINPLDHTEAGADLAAVMPAMPDGIVLPKSRSPEDLELLGRRIGNYEAEYEIKVGSTRILPIATETPQSLFCPGRLSAMRTTPGRPDLGRGRSQRRGRRDYEPGRTRQLDSAIPVGPQHLPVCGPCGRGGCN